MHLSIAIFPLESVMSRAEFGYDLRHYGSMLKDRIRVDAYLSAMRRAIRPGCTVLDIGTGTGFFAIMATRFGAAKVYAVDPNASILIAKEIAKANDAANMIEFLQADSTKLDLPPVDVLMSDLRGVVPLFGQHLNSIADARDRLMRSDGIQIPQSDDLFITGVENEDLYRRATSAADTIHGVSMQPLYPYLSNTWMTVESDEIASDECLLTSDEHWHTIDYRTVTSPNVHGKATLIPKRPGQLHGYLIWFRAHLLPGIHYDTRPKPDYQVYGRMFFPLEQPIHLVESDQVHVDLRASLLSSIYTWRWSTECVTAEGTAKASYKQSTFLGAPVSKAELDRRSADESPQKGPVGEAAMHVLASLDGQQTLDQVANDLFTTFPNQFSDIDNAIGFAGDVALRYAE